MPYTRATTGRLAKAKAKERMSRLVKSDDEVSFPNIIGFKTIDEYCSPQEGPRNSLIHEARVANIEDQVREVKRDVEGINDKIDMLINATARNSKPVLQSTPPRRRQAAQRFEPESTRLDDTINDEPLPPPTRLRKTQNHDGYVDRILDSDKFITPRVKGKREIHDDMFTERDMPKPYMYIQREECQTPKQKLDIRCTIAPLEYINATIALIRDRRAYDPQDLSGILRHLQDVTHDAMERSWPLVRKWSQHIWDQVEKGYITWADHQAIQNDRVMIMTAPNAPRANTEKAEGGAREYICREYQTRNGCRHRGSHMEGNIRLLHLCAFCDSLSRQCNHSVIACAKKMLYPPRGMQHQDHATPGYGQQNQWRPGPAPPHSMPPMQFPKNAPSAPRPLY